MDVVDPDEVSEEEIGLLMAGERPERRDTEPTTAEGVR
jgi:simple sugar transport system ATP-binding protein